MRRCVTLMGTCLTLVFLSRAVVRPFSTTLSVALRVVAMVIPPVAAVVANRDTGFGPDTTGHDGTAARDCAARRPAPPGPRRPGDRRREHDGDG